MLQPDTTTKLRVAKTAHPNIEICWKCFMTSFVVPLYLYFFCFYFEDLNVRVSGRSCSCVMMYGAFQDAVFLLRECLVSRHVELGDRRRWCAEGRVQVMGPEVLVLGISMLLRP